MSNVYVVMKCLWAEKRGRGKGREIRQEVCAAATEQAAKQINENNAEFHSDSAYDGIFYQAVPSLVFDSAEDFREHIETGSQAELIESISSKLPKSAAETLRQAANDPEKLASLIQAAQDHKKQKAQEQKQAEEDDIEDGDEFHGDGTGSVVNQDELDAMENELIGGE